MFSNYDNFNEEVSAWDVRRAEDLRCMFYSDRLELQPAARSVAT